MLYNSLFQRLSTSHCGAIFFLPGSPSEASSSPETTSGKKHPAKLRMSTGLFTQYSAGKKVLVGKEATEQSIGMAGMPVYSRYATFGKKIQKNTI